MSVTMGCFFLTFLAFGGIVVFALCRGDQVKAGFQVPGVQLFLSYRRNRRK